MIRWVFRYPLTLLFVGSLLPVVLAHLWPDMPGVGDGELLEVPMRLLLAPAYMLIALVDVYAHIEFPVSAVFIFVGLISVDTGIAALRRGLRAGTA